MSKSKTITLPREVVERALKVLEYAANDVLTGRNAATELRAALEQPDHSEQSYMGCLTSDMHELAEWLNTMYEAAKEQIAALEQPQRKLTAQDIADSALLGNIESQFNACMHQEHCKRWKAQADQHAVDHQRESSSDNDLPSENGQSSTTSSSVPFGYKLVPLEPTEEMLRAGCGSESPAMFRESLRRETDGQKTVEMVEKIIQRNLNSYRAMLAAAPQPPTTEQSSAVQSQVERVPYLWYDTRNGDTWTQEAVDEGFCVTDSLIPLYTK